MNKNKNQKEYQKKYHEAKKLNNKIAASTYDIKYEDNYF